MLTVLIFFWKINFIFYHYPIVCLWPCYKLCYASLQRTSKTSEGYTVYDSS